MRPCVFSGNVFGQFLLQQWIAMIQRGIEFQSLTRIGTFLGTTGNRHRAAALQPGQLPHHGPYRPGGSAHHHSLTRLRLADFHQAGPGGETRAAQRPQSGRNRRRRRIQLAQAGRRQHGIILPATAAQHHVARRIIRAFGTDNFAHRGAHHHLAQSHRLGIGFGIIHTPAHIGIE